MKEYHKIQTVFKRDPATNHRTLLLGDYSLPEFHYLRDVDWMWTEKVDGTNIRVMPNGGKICFGGKTERAQIPATLYNALVGLFPPEVFLQTDIDPAASVCLYGEGYGAKIQKGGGNYRQDQSFVLFDVKIGDVWLQRANVEDIGDKLGIDIVPPVGVGSLTDMVSFVRQGFKSHWGDFQAEGVVARPVTELRTRMGHRVITKLKSKDFE